MSRIRRSAPVVAAALTLSTLAAGGGAALATTVPTATPTPRPYPSPQTLCADPAPGYKDKVSVDNITSTSASLSWLRFGCFQYFDSVDYYLDGEIVKHEGGGRVSPHSGSATFTGLEPGTEHTVKAIAETWDFRHQTMASETFTTLLTDPTPKPSPTPMTIPAQTVTLQATGTEVLRTSALAGTASRKSSLKLDLPENGVGSITGSLGAGTAASTFKAIGLVPVTTQLAFSGGPIAAQFDGTTFTGTATEKVTITKATVFGLPLTQGGACRTAADARIPLTSAGTFSPYTGGTLSGTFSLPKFTGCGALASLLGSTGSRSSIVLKLALPAPPAN